MYPVCKLGMGRGTGASSSRLVSLLEDSREVPIRSLFHGARPAWEQLVCESLGSGVLCDSLGSAKLLSYKPDRILPAWRPLHCGPRLSTDTTFENYIDCSLLEVVITGLVEGH